MQQGAVRPRFNLTLAGPVDRHIQRLCNEADRPEHRCVRRVLARHVDLTVIRADHRVGSFTSFTGRQLPNGLVFEIMHAPDRIRVKVVATSRVGMEE